jgi:phosphopantetheinyl transferase
MKEKEIMLHYKIVQGNNYLSVLKNLLNVDNVAIQKDVLKNGKPYLLNNPNFFSISHCNNHTIVVVSDHEVGVDMELIRPYGIKLLKYLNLPKLSDEDFFKEWTKRESFIKLNGLALKNINDLEIENCKFTYLNLNNYAITICER